MWHVRGRTCGRLLGAHLGAQDLAPIQGRPYERPYKAATKKAKQFDCFAFFV